MTLGPLKDGSHFRGTSAVFTKEALGGEGLGVRGLVSGGCSLAAGQGAIKATAAPRRIFRADSSP